MVTQEGMHMYLGSIRPNNGSIKSAKAFQFNIDGNLEPILRLYAASVTEKDKWSSSATHFLTTPRSYRMNDPILETR